MKAKFLPEARDLSARLHAFETRQCPLPALDSAGARASFVTNLIESIRRVRYISTIRTRGISARRAEPASRLFDPLKAAVLLAEQGRFDEACWMVFASVHFGKNRKTGWRLAGDVIGALGSKNAWNWERISRRPESFRHWLHKNYSRLRGGDGVERHFGNHRKYLSLDAWSDRGTGEAFATYVAWVGTSRDHRLLFSRALTECGGDPTRTFESLFRSMDKAVASFGRTGCFDYLTMIGKLGLARIEPGSTYMAGATGPHRGARLLFQDKSATRRTLDDRLIRLGAALNLPMHVIEDAVCNWQKSPNAFRPYRG